MPRLATVAVIGWKVLDRFRFGSRFAISPHGLGIAIGYLAGAYVLVHEAKKRGITEDQSGAMVFWALVGAIVGARFFYVVAHFGEPGLKTIGDVFAVYRGGISLLGGIFGAVIFAYPLMRRYKLRFLQAMDTAAIGLPLGIVIGRIGDLVIGDHLGKPTSWLLAIRYDGGTLSGYTCSAGRCVAALFGGQSQEITHLGATHFGQAGQILGHGIGVHQTALYDFLSTMVLVLVLVWMNRRPRRTGIMVMTFATWYAGMRIITDFLRVDKRFFGLTGSQWGSVLVVVLCVATLIRFAMKPEHPGDESPPGESPTEQPAEASPA
jgi:phosphatidylglycerol:prolipoprotein diacylglycerol transferase